MDSLRDPARRDLILPLSVKDVTVRLARPDERRRWDATMAWHHPLGFRGFAAAGLRYVAEYEGCWLALLGWQSGAFKCRPRRPVDRLAAAEQFPRLHQIANNTRMLGCAHRAHRQPCQLCMAADLRRLSAAGTRTSGIPWSWPKPSSIRPSSSAPCIVPATGSWSAHAAASHAATVAIPSPTGAQGDVPLPPACRRSCTGRRAPQPCPTWQPRQHRVTPTDVPEPSLLQEFGVSPIIAAASRASTWGAW